MPNKRAKVSSNADIIAALAKGLAEVDDTPAAESVKYVPAHDIFIMNLKNGTRTVLQREKLQGLQAATKAQAAHVELLGRGTGLHWPDLDVDLYVPSLVAGVYGSKQWMKEMGRRGGMVTSEAKAQAARENGQKGGRPSKVAIAAKNVKAFEHGKRRSVSVRTYKAGKKADAKARPAN